MSHFCQPDRRSLGRTLGITDVQEAQDGCQGADTVWQVLYVSPKRPNTWDHSINVFVVISFYLLWSLKGPRKTDNSTLHPAKRSRSPLFSSFLVYGDARPRPGRLDPAHLDHCYGYGYETTAMKLDKFHSHSFKNKIILLLAGDIEMNHKQAQHLS